MIHAERLALVAQGQCLFRDVLFNVARGECVTIVGSSTFTRTMLWRVLAVLVPPTSGRVEINGVDGAIDPCRARRHLFAAGSVPLSLSVPVDDYMQLAAVGRKGMDRRARGRLIETTGVGPDRRLDTLEDDERHLVDLCAAATSGAPLWVLNAPLSRGNSLYRERCRSLIRAGRHAGAAIVMTAEHEHDTLALSDRTVVLEDTEHVYASPARSRT
jgi:ABC-type Na+ transport system ATPase subunit NatA